MALMPVADALAQVLKGAQPLPSENVPLAKAAVRVLAADVAAKITQPPADLSAMDGEVDAVQDLDLPIPRGQSGDLEQGLGHDQPSPR